MADERPIHQDDELPAWLRGHIQPEPGGESRPRPDADAEAMSAEDIAAAFEPADDSGEAPPRGTDEGAAVDLPPATELKGLTGQLPWLSDVVDEQGAAEPGTPPGDEDAEVLDWLSAEEPEAGAPSAPATLSTSRIFHVSGRRE